MSTEPSSEVPLAHDETPQQPTPRPTFRRRLWRFFFGDETQTLFILIAVGISVTALIVSLGNQRRVKIDVEDGAQTEDVQYILERANDATQFADTILSWLEGASVILGVLIVVGGWMFRNSVQRQIEESQEQVQTAVGRADRFLKDSRQVLEERGKRLDDLEADLGKEQTSLEDELREAQQRLERELRDAQLELEKQFRQAQADLKQELHTSLEAAVAESKTRFAEVQTRAEDRFRVLSLQLLAEQQVRSHNVESAIKTLEAAHSIDETDPTTNYLLGYLLTARRDMTRAVGHLETAIKAAPNFVPAMAALGLALRRIGDKIKESERLAERNTYWAQAELKLLEALRQDSSLTDAEGESYFGTLGGLYRRQKRYDDAINAYEEAHRVTPSKSYPIVNLATIYAHQGNQERALHFFRLVVEKARLELDDDPRNTWTRCDLAQARLVLGQHTEALQELEQVLAQDPETGVLETVRSGLAFLAESPLSIDGLDDMLAVVDRALAQHEARAHSHAAESAGR